MSEVRAAATRRQRLKNGEDLVTVYCHKMPGEQHTQMAGVIAAKLRATDCERLAEWALPLLDETPLTEDWLRSIGGEWDDTQAAFQFNHRRLIVWVRGNGQWWLDFDATYCGKVGTYKRLTTRGNFRQAMEVFGIELKEPTH